MHFQAISYIFSGTLDLSGNIPITALVKQGSMYWGLVLCPYYPVLAASPWPAHTWSHMTTYY